MPDHSQPDIPTPEDMRLARNELAPHIAVTPVHHWIGPEIEHRLPAHTQAILKLELFQRTGTFKIRGALLNIMHLDRDSRARGVTAVSAGNHAVAVACAASRLKVSAKVVMIQTANPARIAAARDFGAEVVLAPDGKSAFALVERIAAEEGRSFIHPFDGRNVTLATGGVGVEFLAAVPDLDAVVVAIGGGGLMAGVAAAVKQINPRCAVYGVEPEGADIMSRSFRAGAPQTMDKVATIADSLAPPLTTGYVFNICRKYVDDIVTVTDDAICAAMVLLFREMKLVVEPAGAAAVAAVLGPLHDRVKACRVGIVVCGSNIDRDSYMDLLVRGERAF